MGILDELHRAAYLRHSYRNFTSDAIDDGARKEIERFIASLETPFENHTKCVFFKAACGKRLYNNERRWRITSCLNGMNRMKKYI